MGSGRPTSGVPWGVIVGHACRSEGVVAQDTVPRQRGNHVHPRASAAWAVRAMCRSQRVCASEPQLKPETS